MSKLIPFVLFFGSVVAAAQAPSKEIAELKNQISALKAKIAVLETNRQEIYRRLSNAEFASSRYRTATLDLASKNYQRLDTDMGSFMVAAESVEPYLDGYKVVLSIGNPMLATFNGFKLRVEWATSITKAADYETWEKTRQQKEISFTEPLQPGRWNQVELLLPSTKPDQLGYFNLSLDISTISLSGRR
jgi:hypothetical protein